MRLGFAVAALIAVSAAACGEETIDPGQAERSLTSTVQKRIGFKIAGVRCPSGVEAKVGESFECTYRAPDGPYTATLRVTSVDGEQAGYAIRSRPTGPRFD